MTTVRRALALSFLERYLSIMLALASNMVLARLLTPHEIGLYSVTLAVIGVAQVLRDFGIGNYLIQEKEITDAHVGTAFGISLLLGGTLFLLVVMLAPVAASFYEEPAMAATMRIAALNFLVLPFCTVSMSLLRRAMRFQALLYVSLGATALSLLVTVALAWSGWGANSMAVGSVVQSLAIALGTWLASQDRLLHMPTLVLWRPLLRFGGQSALTNVVTTISMDANDLVVGKVLGFQSVAMISRAQGLMNLFHRDVMGAIRNVAMPAFAQAHREGQADAASFGRALSLLTVFAWPFYGLTAMFALEVLRLLFGLQWDAAASMVPIFCLSGALGALNSLVPSWLVAVGRIDLLTRMELLVQPLRLLLVVAAALVWRSVEAVAIAFLLSSLVAAPGFLWAANRATPGIFKVLMPSVAPSLLVASFVLLPALVCTTVFGLDRQQPLPLVWLAASVAAGIALGLAACERVNHPLCREPAYQSLKARLWRMFTWV